MTIEEFLDFLISERMEMHAFQRRKQFDNKVDDGLELEKLCNQALDTLPLSMRNAITEYYEYLMDLSAEGEAFFYHKGLKDGFLLYRFLSEL